MQVPFHHEELLNPTQYSLRPELAEFKLLVKKKNGKNEKRGLKEKEQGGHETDSIRTTENYPILQKY